MEETDKYQVVVCNISWSSRTRTIQAKREFRSDLPTQMSLDIPKQVLDQANKNKDSFNDIIEQFCYNILTKKFGREVAYCQIWLPL